MSGEILLCELCNYLRASLLCVKCQDRLCVMCICEKNKTLCKECCDCCELDYLLCEHVRVMHSCNVGISGICITCEEDAITDEEEDTEELEDEEDLEKGRV